jgi:diadenosine tetraphosphate (Ap4A) HIT family hydrolase
LNGFHCHVIARYQQVSSWLKAESGKREERGGGGAEKKHSKTFNIQHSTFNNGCKGTVC